MKAEKPKVGSRVTFDKYVGTITKLEWDWFFVRWDHRLDDLRHHLNLLGTTIIVKPIEDPPDDGEWL